MPYSVVEKKLRSIPESYMHEIMEFLSLIEYKVMYEQSHSDSEEPAFERKLGILKGQIKIADDFDETPDCFKEYM